MKRNEENCKLVNLDQPLKEKKYMIGNIISKFMIKQNTVKIVLLRLIETLASSIQHHNGKRYRLKCRQYCKIRFERILCPDTFMLKE